MRNRQTLLSLSILTIIFTTTFVFDQTQSFYKAFIQGKRYFEKREYQQAFPFLISAAEIKPEDKNSSIYLLWTYANLGKKREASDLAKIIVEKNPEDSLITEQVADVYYKIADYKMAEKLYRKVLEKKDALGVKKKLAEVLMWQEKYDEGISIIKELLKAHPDDLNLVELLADSYSWEKNYDKAIELYNELLTKNFKPEGIMLKLADTLRHSGKNEEAVKVYRKYLER